MFHCLKQIVQSVDCVFRVNKHATSIHLHWYIRRLCSGMNWCWWMLLLQKSVAFLKQLTAFGDREGCVVGYRLGASRSSSTVSDSLHQELMICQTKALWSNIRWIMAFFFLEMIPLWLRWWCDCGLWWPSEVPFLRGPVLPMPPASSP